MWLVAGCCWPAGVVVAAAAAERLLVALGAARAEWPAARRGVAAAAAAGIAPATGDRRTGLRALPLLMQGEERRLAG